jgi:methionyl-tRNA synthetase
VGATEFLNYEGQKFSKTQGIGIWCDEALELLPADYWRYTLTYSRPEIKDTNFSWKTLEYTVNEELNNHIGNLLHRLLTFIRQHFGGVIPDKGKLSDNEARLIEKIDEVRSRVDKYYMNMRFQRVLSEVMEVARLANATMNREEPWKTVKTDKKRAGSTLYAIAMAVKAIAVMLNPIIPESSSRILRYLGYDGEVKWDLIDASPEGWKIDLGFKPVFFKIDTAELKKKLIDIRQKAEATRLVDTSVLEKLDIRVGKINDVSEVPDSDELYVIKVKVGDRIYTSVAKIRGYYDKDDLLGKKVIVITNLKPRTIKGIRSEVMLLAALEKDALSLLTIDRDLNDGAKVY